MKSKLSFVATVLALAALWLVPVISVRAADCFNCAKDSTGKCDGAQQCRGSRDDCRKAGCKISGTASCSSAANVEICLSVDPHRGGEPISTPSDPARHACFGD